MKVALVYPAPTVTVAGTVADGLLLLNATAAPPTGAGPFSVTVPVELFPPSTLVGLRPKELTVGGIIVNVAVRVPAP